MSETTPAVADRPLEDDDIVLTDAEREAMEDGDDDADADAEKETEQEKGAETSAEQAEPATTTATEAAPAQVNVPLIRAEDTAAATARLAAIDTEADDLAARFDDGDLTAKEYGAGLKALEAERRDLDWSIRKAELSAEVAEQQATQAWFTAVTEFVAEHAEIKPNTLRWTAFDTAVRMVTGDDANAGLTNRKKLEKAYEMLNAEFGPTARPAAAPKAATPPPAERRPLPPNLSRIPASAVNDADESRYAALDQMVSTDPIGYEARLAQMSPAELEAYSAAR